MGEKGAAGVLMTRLGIRTIRGRIVLAIFLVGCIPLFIGLLLASVSGMRSLRNVIGGNFQAIASEAADRVTMLVESHVQALKLLASAPLRVRQPVSVANASYPSRRSISDVIQERTRAWDRALTSQLGCSIPNCHVFYSKPRCATAIGSSVS